jgi:hypothetical protein
MRRHSNFGVGVTLVVMGFALGHWIFAMDRNDNMPVAALVAAVLIGPGATLIGKAIWPPDK